MAVAATELTRAEAEEFLYLEARLLDDGELERWLELFAEEGLYWIPIDDSKPTTWNTSLVYDDKLRREERVFHLLKVPFPAQSPRSRTVHVVTNVEAEPAQNGAALVRSNQLIYETRLGDFRQVGLGEVRTLVARVEHLLERRAEGLRIARKKILLIDRELPQSNLTFLI